MSTIDPSTWNPDADLNVEIEGIPLNSDASIAQTWQALRVLMAAVKGDGDSIKSFLVPFTGATASADGASGFVPAPDAGDEEKFLKGDGTWTDLASTDIPGLDASKITSGTIDLARLPAGALERLVPVADQTARYALTTADVQLGDTVKEIDTGLLYFVVDTAKLDSADGYVVYTAGMAAAVPWSGVTGKPTTLSGYGITDAKIVDGTITLGSNTITPIDTVKVNSTALTVSSGDVSIPNASTSAYGCTKLSSATNSTSEALAATAKAVKTAYDLANGKQSPATTLSGYGITDAKIANGTITLGSNTITPLTSASALDATKLSGTASVDTTGNAATASAVAWSSVTDKPSSFTPSSHTHGSITNDGKLGTASRAVVTDGDKEIGVSSVTATELGYLSGVTSAVQTQLDAKATDASVLHNSTAEALAGSKTGDMQFVKTSNGSFARLDNTSKRLLLVGGTTTGAGQGSKFTLFGKDYGGTNAGGTFELHAGSGIGSVNLLGKPDGTLSWDGDPIQTSSDRRLKTQIETVPDDVLDAWGHVCWNRFRWKSSIAAKGSAARFHLGLVAQDVYEVFSSRSIEACAYGILCHVERPADEGSPADERWTVRYAEALAMEAAYQRRRADVLERRIEALESALRKGEV